MIPAMPYSRNEGCNTWVGQELTQRWQAVQKFVKCSMLRAPGATTGVFLDFSNSLLSERPVRGKPIMDNSPADDPTRTLLLFGSTGGRRGGSFFLKAYFNPSVGHELTQSKHPTQAAKSMVRFLLSIHLARHTRSHNPQSLHLSCSIVIRKSDTREIRLRIPPTGQRVLQKKRP